MRCEHERLQRYVFCVQEVRLLGESDGRVDRLRSGKTWSVRSEEGCLCPGLVCGPYYVPHALTSFWGHRLLVLGLSLSL